MVCYANGTCVHTPGAATHALTAAAVQYFMAIQFLSENSLPEADVLNFKSFDFIIIGGGTTGCVIANRLSEVKQWNILLIEAGGDPPLESSIPGFDSSIVGTEHDWKCASSENRVIDQAIINGSIKLPRGKMFGGCSSLNGMVYVRGNDQDYQNWYDAGNIDWSLGNVRRCFKKAEGLKNKKMLKDPSISQFYGLEGPLVINKYNNTYEHISHDIIKSWHEIGVKYVADLNVAGLNGSGTTPVTVSNGIRQSVNKAYLTPIANRMNLKILKNTLVKKILIDEKTKVTFGVQVERYGKNMTFFAIHEVIVSAGTIKSPQILMLSGVGPKNSLMSNNITCIIDSPMVGKNLQDHAAVPLPIFANTPEKSTEIEQQFDTINYVFNHKGILAQSSVKTDVVSYFATQNDIPEPECSAHLVILPKNSTNIEEYFKKLYGFEDLITNKLVKKNKKYALYLFNLNLLHPYSRGSITLNSNDPRDNPVTHLNYFDDVKDLETLVKGLQAASKIVNATFFKDNLAFIERLQWPACDVFEMFTDKYWECISLNMATSTHDLVGSCKMGANVSTSVVDSHLRVHGVTHLRVIDASIMPSITSGSTMAPCIMIGERGAELLKEQYYRNGNRRWTP